MPSCSTRSHNTSCHTPSCVIPPLPHQCGQDVTRPHLSTLPCPPSPLFLSLSLSLSLPHLRPTHSRMSVPASWLSDDHITYARGRTHRRHDQTSYCVQQLM